MYARIQAPTPPHNARTHAHTRTRGGHPQAEEERAAEAEETQTVKERSDAERGAAAEADALLAAVTTRAIETRGERIIKVLDATAAAESRDACRILSDRLELSQLVPSCAVATPRLGCTNI